MLIVIYNISNLYIFSSLKMLSKQVNIPCVLERMLSSAAGWNTHYASVRSVGWFCLSKFSYSHWLSVYIGWHLLTEVFEVSSYHWSIGHSSSQSHQFWLCVSSHLSLGTHIFKITVTILHWFRQHHINLFLLYSSGWHNYLSVQRRYHFVIFCFACWKMRCCTSNYFKTAMICFTLEHTFVT